MKRYSLKELAAMPTLCVGQADSLKVEDGDTQVWISRCGAADGEPYDNKVTIMRRKNGRWEEVETYQAK